MKKWSILGLVVILSSVFLLTACEKGQPPITAADIVAKMKDAVTNTKDAHVTMDFTGDLSGLSSQATKGNGSVEVWYTNAMNSRVEVKNSSVPELNGAILIKNGNDIWGYLPSQNTVYKGGFDFGIPMSDQIINTMLDGMTGDLQMVLDYMDVTRQADGVIAGKPAYQLKLVPKEPSAGQVTIPINATAFLWVDQATWLPLKAEVQAGMLGSGSITVTKLETNIGVPDSTFQFTPPAGAKIIDKTAAATSAAQTLTLDQAKASAGFALLVPTYVPNGATLSEVLKVQQPGMGEMFVLNYNHVPNGFSVVQAKSTAAVDLTKALPTKIPNATTETVTVRGQQGTLITGTGSMIGSFLTWEENGVRIGIAGTIGKDDVLKIADSLK